MVFIPPIPPRPVPELLNRFTNFGKLTDSTGTIKQIDTDINGRLPAVAANGDRFFFYFICDGTETMLTITTFLETDRGIFDIYVNNVLDSSGYDDYNPVPTITTRNIVLTQSIVKNANIIEARVNGKNVASVDFIFQCSGASLQ